MADGFLSMVASKHILLDYITNGYNPRFCSDFWDELMSLLDMTLTFSTTMDLLTDRMDEVTNCTMKKLLWIHL